MRLRRACSCSRGAADVARRRRQVASRTPAGGTAPVVNVGPAAGLTSCTQTVLRGAITSCSFAQNVFDAVSSYDAANGEIPAHLTVYSPAVSQNFAVSCEIRNQDEVTCTTKTRGLVVFTTNSLGG